jgi:membrane protease YdiL (CAAX protease family)
MLFVLKRTWAGSLVGLAILVPLGLALRRALGTGPPLGCSAAAALLGAGVFGVVLCSDGLLHGLFLLLFGERYRRRHRELAALFRGQTFTAILAGALMAGAGEELVFRGLSADLRYLIPAAILFGLLHHVRRALWPFTLWAVWQGLLFATALYVFETLFVTMVAHFLHDLAGFLIFRYLNRAGPKQEQPGEPLTSSPLAPGP